MRNVDGLDTMGLSPEEVASYMRGKKDTKASIRVERKKETLDFTVLRNPFKFRAQVSSRDNINGKDVALLSIRSFDFSTCDNVVKAITDIKQKGPLQAIVLDLRGIIIIIIIIITIYIYIYIYTYIYVGTEVTSV